MDSWNCVASSGSSTAESASLVSPLSWHLPFVWCLFGCLWLVCGLGWFLFLFASRVLQVLGDVLILPASSG